MNLGYPHPNTGNNTNTVNQQIAKDAIIAADPFIDYSAYDTNNDNIIDSDELAVVVVVAGFERAYSPNLSPSVWAHKWSIGPSVGAPTVDGVLVGDFNNGKGGYAQFGEIHRSNASDHHQANMGVMVHELGHLIFGLPDLYDRDGSSTGIGAFGVMGTGSWGQSNSASWPGDTPVLPCAWTKLKLGWVDEIEGTGSEMLFASGSNQAGSFNSVRKSSSVLPNEYFLSEVRHPAGYDRGLERWLGLGFGGLAIWHIDDSRPHNDTDTWRLVDLEEADNTPMGIGPGQPTDFWYQGNNGTFDDRSSPSSRLRQGSFTGTSIAPQSPPGSSMLVIYGGTVSNEFSVSPATGMDITGEEGGPFNNSTKQYTLVNPTASSMTYSVTKSQPWLDVSNSSGTITPGGSAVVTVSINATANGLPIGNHTDSVIFTNTTNGTGNTTRLVTLVVTPEGLADYSVALGGEGFDMALDPARNRMYVSVPSLNEIVVISTLNYNIADRIFVGNRPHGIDISHDNQVLYIALNGAGKVGVLDLDTRALSTISVISGTDHALIYDVAEAKPNRVFVSASPGSGGSARIAMIKTDQGNVISQVAGNRIIRSSPIFLKDPTQQFLYLGESTHSPNSLYKMDISQDTAPVILEDGHGTVSGTGYMDITPDGSKIFLKSGQVLDTTTLSGPGALNPGVPAVAPDSALVYMGRAPNILDVFNGTTFLKENEINTQCPTSEFQRLKILPNHSGWVVLGNNKVCARDLEGRGNGIPGVLAVVQHSNLESFGEIGGPFLPGSKTYTLTNTGGETIDFSVTQAQNWLDLTNNSGTLAPQSSKQIVVSINSEALELAAGTYRDTLTLTNLTNGMGNISLDVELYITPLGFGFSRNLGGDGFGVATAPSRNRLYVSVPSLNEIVIFSTFTREVGRISLSSPPYGLDVSEDEKFLYIALHGSGNVGVLNLDTMTLTTVPVQTETGSPMIYDVVEAKSNRVFVSANPGTSANAYIAMIKTDEGNTVSRVADGRIIHTNPKLLKDPNQEFLYVGEQSSPNSLYKLDISQDSAPIILEDIEGTIVGTQHMSLDQDGSKIYLNDGQVVNSSTFEIMGTLGPGVPGNHLSQNSSLISLARTPNILDSYSTTNLQKFSSSNLENCSLSNIEKHLIIPDFYISAQYLLGNDKLCGQTITNPNRDRVPNDFNGDGQSDLLLVHDIGLIATGLLKEAQLAEFDFLLWADPAQGWTVNSTGDFNGDSKSDILLYNTVTGELRVVEVNGTSVLNDRVVGIMDPAFDLIPLRMADFNADDRAEILVYDPATGFTALLFFDNTGAFASFEFVTLVDVGNDWTMKGAGDFNADRKMDLMLFNTVSKDIAIIEMDGSSAGPLTYSFTLDPAANLSIEDIGDFTGDGRADIYLKSPTGTLSITNMKGTVYQTTHTLGGIPSGWNIINVGHYEGESDFNFFNGDPFMDFLIFDSFTGDLMSLIHNRLLINNRNLYLNLGLNSGWSYHGGKP